MCYLPYLDLTVIVEVIGAARPSLYLGSDLVGSTVSRVLVSVHFAAIGFFCLTLPAHE
jgi:hypothetical protein